jgi:hypothetical protein
MFAFRAKSIIENTKSLYDSLSDIRGVSYTASTDIRPSSLPATASWELLLPSRMVL